MRKVEVSLGRAAVRTQTVSTISGAERTRLEAKRSERQRIQPKREAWAAWIEEMQALDKKIPRPLEDLIDTLDRLGVMVVPNLPAKAKEAYERKKVLRASIPEKVV